MAKFNDAHVSDQLETLHAHGEETLIKSLAPQYGLKYINLNGITINPNALGRISEERARKAEAVIFDEGFKAVSIALKNPNNPEAKAILAELKEHQLTVNAFMTSTASLEHGWERYQDSVDTEAEVGGILDIDPDQIIELSENITSHLDVANKIYEVREANDTKRVSKTIEVMFAGARALGASDIHIEPEKQSARLRYRIDGVLWDICSIENHIHPRIASRLKLLSGLKLNIKNEAQDGRFSFVMGERQLEIRTSVIPGGYGETLVMRLLDPDASVFQMENLGLNEKIQAVITRELQRPNGAIVTTGPTGSGKTTALYAFLQQVHQPEKKIITIEDPIEYKLPGVVQTQVDEDYTFASGLRSILRQDPDVIMVGEIRDREVAETATHAALTGHLVFSTLHTNSAVGAFPRLIDIGVDARLIGSAFNLVMAQRLVRQLCEHCRTPRDATTEEQKLIARIMDEPVAAHTLYEAPGCPECNGSGYGRRIGIFEGIVVDKAVEEALIHDPRESNILTAAKPQGIPTMPQDGILKALKGITSLDELSRVIDLYNTKSVADTDEEIQAENT